MSAVRTTIIGRDADHEIICNELKRLTPDQLQQEVPLRLQRQVALDSQTQPQQPTD